MHFVKIIVVMLLTFSSYLASAKESVEMFRYSPIDQFVFELKNPWTVDLKFTGSNKLETWNIKSSTRYVYSDPSARATSHELIFQKIVSQNDVGTNLECAAYILLEKVYSSGELRYFLRSTLDKPECIPNSVFLSLKMVGNKNIGVVVMGVNGSILAEGTATPINDDVRGYNMTALTQEEFTHNQKLLDNRDELIGYWEGQLDGQKIGFYNWYKKPPGVTTNHESGGFLIGDSDDCVLEISSAQIPHQRQLLTDLKAFEMENSPYEYINSFRYWSHTNLADNKTECSPSSTLNGWRERGTFFIMMPTKQSNKALLKKYFIKDIDYDFVPGLVTRNFKAILVSEGTVTRGVLPDRLKKYLSNQWKPVKRFLESAAAAHYFDPNKTYASVWKAQYSDWFCNNGPFCYIEGGDFISAVYDGDFKKIRQLEESVSLHRGERLISDFVDDYIFHYKEYFASCIEPNAETRTYEKNVKQVNNYGVVVLDSTYESVYQVNPNFLAACDRVCGYRGFQDIFTEGSTLAHQTGRGVIELMKKFDCKDPAIKKLESNMIKALNN